MDFAERVKVERMRREMSQETLAVAAGLSRKTVQNVEAGRRFSAETALALRSVLEIDREPLVVVDPLLEAYLDRIPEATDEATAAALTRRTRITAIATMVTAAMGLLAQGAHSLGALPWDPSIPAFLAMLMVGATFAYSVAVEYDMRTQGQVDLERGAARERFMRDPAEREAFRSALSSKSGGERLAGA